MLWRPRWNPFKLACLLAAALYAYLFVSLLFSPESTCRGFGLAVTDALAVLARRTSMLMLGFSVLLVAARDLRPSPGRRAISLAVAINMAGFAAAGTHELRRGALAPSMWNAVAVEVSFAAAFLALWVRDWRAAAREPEAPEGACR